jgi:hypothetical protein
MYDPTTGKKMTAEEIVASRLLSFYAQASLVIITRGENYTAEQIKLEVDKVAVRMAREICHDVTEELLSQSVK